ncbi:MAG: OmpA family protein [Magnetococcales bacterium]|nr:OmpA family protein [Magnetococcales bacterium]
MHTKMKFPWLLIALWGLLLIPAAPVQAEEITTPWMAAGWWQWHPQQGSYILGRIGTQLYFAPPDQVVSPPSTREAPLPLQQSNTIHNPVPTESNLCSNPPPGALVNDRGCWIIGKVLFGFDRSNVRKKYGTVLKKVVEVMHKYPGMRVEIQGHTDSIGTESYNEKLSLRRAESVKQSLIHLGIASQRLAVVGFGEGHPLNGNKTPKQRAANRRVEIIPQD